MTDSVALPGQFSLPLAPGTAARSLPAVLAEHARLDWPALIYVRSDFSRHRRPSKRSEILPLSPKRQSGQLLDKTGISGLL